MANLRQFRSLMSGAGLRATIAALAIVLVLTVVTTNVAHAQSFQVIYNFHRFHGRGQTICRLDD